MALLGQRSPSLLTTEEMNEKQFQEFKAGWIGYEVFLLSLDGISESIAMMTACSEFETLQAQGFKTRNANVLKNRRIRLSKIAKQ